MYKNVLQSIEGIEIYPILSLIIFVSFFALMGIWVMKAKKSYLDSMANMPLRDNDADTYDDDAK